MKKRILSLFLAVCLLLSAVPVAHAVQPPETPEDPLESPFTDISGHWGERFILQAVSQGLFAGTSSTTFSPNVPMTRGMFVTVLGRVAGIDPDEWRDDTVELLFQDVDADAYYAPFVYWAVRNGVTSGTGEGTFSPDMQITREQMTLFALRIASVTNCALTSVYEDGEEPVTEIADEAEISSWAHDAVFSLLEAGILRGSLDLDGAAVFRPKASASRAEGATFFCRVLQSLKPLDTPVIAPTGITLQPQNASLQLGEAMPLAAQIQPQNATNQTVTWVSSAPDVVCVDQNGVATRLKNGTVTVTAYTCNGFAASCTFQDDSVAPADESYAEKCIRIFGQVVDDPRLYYSSGAEAEAHMVTLSILVWDFNSAGEKVTKTMRLTVHENIAATVAAIFDEIYNGDEKFPIHSVGGYRNAGKSEHTPGLAIDINPNENYYCSPTGAAITGSFWDPERSPYSIPLDGDVARAFQRHGFKRGIYWQSGYKDYMHFSYFGT